MLGLQAHSISTLQSEAADAVRRAEAEHMALSLRLDQLRSADDDYLHRARGLIAARRRELLIHVVSRARVR